VSGDAPRPDEGFRTEPLLWRSVGKAAVLGLVIGALAMLIAHLSDTPAAPVLVVGLPPLALMLLQLVRVSIVELPPRERAPVPIVPVAEYFVRLRHLERRLERASKDVADFDWNLRPLLARLAAERLEHRHGIRIRTEPEKARQIVGEQLWQILTTSPQAMVGPTGPDRVRELVAAISRI